MTDQEARDALGSAAAWGQRYGAREVTVQVPVASLRALLDAFDRKSPEPVNHPYRVGDEDPTPDLNYEEYCDAEHAAAESVCTWRKGHAGVHVAGDGDVIRAVWEEGTA